MSVLDATPVDVLPADARVSPLRIFLDFCERLRRGVVACDLCGTGATTYRCLPEPDVAVDWLTRNEFTLAVCAGCDVSRAFASRERAA